MGKLIGIVKCPRCDGSGVVPWREIKDAKVYDLTRECPKCEGRKKVWVIDKS